MCWQLYLITADFRMLVRQGWLQKTSTDHVCYVNMVRYIRLKEVLVFCMVIEMLFCTASLHLALTFGRVDRKRSVCRNFWYIGNVRIPSWVSATRLNTLPGN